VVGRDRGNFDHARRLTFLWQRSDLTDRRLKFDALDFLKELEEYLAMPRARGVYQLTLQLSSEFLAEMLPTERIERRALLVEFQGQRVEQFLEFSRRQHRFCQCALPRLKISEHLVAHS
jgi:hypothetical protein